MRSIGLHLRFESSLVDIIQKAKEFDVDFFQSFLTLKSAGRVIPLRSNDMTEFVHLRQQYFNDLYLHISYWVNLSTIAYNPHKLLKKELERAKRLEFTHVIFHPGSAKGAKRKSEGINALAKMLNKLINQEHDLKIVIENIAQGWPSIGGDLLDFKKLLEKIDHPDKLFFCIDTAHAYSFGYDLVGKKEQQAFIDVIDSTVGIDRVALIHLNDSYEELGSKIDRHHEIGKGTIGEEPLKRFVLHQDLKDIPILMELPEISDAEVMRNVQKVKGWHK